MLKELSKFNNLGTPSYFYELFSVLNKNKDIKEHEIKEYFFNKTIDKRQSFDGCLPLLETLGIIKIDKIKTTINIHSLYKEKMHSIELIKEKILETFFIKYKEDNEFLNIFVDFIFDNSYPKSTLINSSSFKLKYMNIKRFLIDFDFLIIHPDKSYYFINKIYIDLFNKYILSQSNSSNEYQKVNEEQPPKVFISYSWDDEDHKNWVLNLANKLAENGINPILDRYELRPGSNAPYFMETALKESNKVLIIFTENYQTKAMGRKGGVGYEYSILTAEICKNITDNKKYIPILRSGTTETSIPPFLHQLISIYMKDDKFFEENFKEAMHAIFDKPLIKKPNIGKKPNYLSSK